MVLAVMACGVVTTSSLAQTPTPTDTTAEEGIRFSYPDDSNGELSFEEKVAELNARVLADPTDAKSWNDLGVLYAQAERWDVARDAFIKAIQASPQEGDFHRNLGLVFSRLEMFEMAVAEFEAYRRFDAMGGKDFWRLIGEAQRRAGDPNAARKTFTEGIEAMSPDLGPEGLRLVLALNRVETEAGDEQAVRKLLEQYTPAAISFLKHVQDESDDGAMEARSLVHNRVTQMVDDGRLMEQSNLLDEAASNYRDAYDLAPERDDLLPRLVDVYLRSDQSMDARVAARKAREEHPDKAGTWIATGKVYEQTNRLDDAVDAYKKAFEIDPNMADLRVAIGNLLMRLGRDTEARQFLQEGVNTRDTKPEVVYNYAVSLIREKKYHAAIASLRSVVKERPEMIQAWSALAQCYRVTKQYGAAVQPYEKVMEMQPEPKTAYNLGYCAMKAKRHETAIAAYLQALTLDPTMVEARYNLSLTYMDAERYEEAVASFEEMLILEPNSYRVYYSQGLSLYYLGRYEDALDRYERAMDLKETVNLHNNIGLVYDKLGDKKEAQSWYKSAQELKNDK